MDEGMDLKQTARSLVTSELSDRLDSKLVIGARFQMGQWEALFAFLLILLNRGREMKT